MTRYDSKLNGCTYVSYRLSKAVRYLCKTIQFESYLVITNVFYVKFHYFSKMKVTIIYIN